MAQKRPALKYKKIFKPRHVERRLSGEEESTPQEVGDLRRDPVYVYTDEIVLAVNVALATGRPLLVRGKPGAGKSSLARNAAHVLGWRYYETVITSRTQAQHLLWEIDHLRRLRDAEAETLTEDYTPYVQPGSLWWAFDPKSAGELDAKDPNQGAEHRRAVVLLDEIDKADPDEPNNLLVPLGSFQFLVEETQTLVKTTPERAPLVFLTTNEERELPAAFLRRCVELKIELPTRKRLLEIGAAHFPESEEGELEAFAEALLGPLETGTEDEPVDVNPAEFVDTLRACRRLNVKPGTTAWQALTNATIWKFGRRP